MRFVTHFVDFHIVAGVADQHFDFVQVLFDGLVGAQLEFEDHFNPPFLRLPEHIFAVVVDGEITPVAAGCVTDAVPDVFETARFDLVENTPVIIPPFEGSGGLRGVFEVHAGSEAGFPDLPAGAGSSEVHGFSLKPGQLRGEGEPFTVPFQFKPEPVAITRIDAGDEIRPVRENLFAVLRIKLIPLHGVASGTGHRDGQQRIPFSLRFGGDHQQRAAGLFNPAAVHRPAAAAFLKRFGPEGFRCGLVVEFRRKAADQHIP